MTRIVLAILLSAFAFAASAERYAYILGNTDYFELSDLSNTHADAEAYAQTFGNLGFKITLVKDLDRKATLQSFHLFLNNISSGDEVAFIYSGHGWSNGQTNFLIPTDVERPAPDFQAILEDSTLPLQNGYDGFLDKLAKRGVSLTIAVIDACRNNPFAPLPGRKSVGMSRGLAPVVPSEGTFIIYSAGKGQEALDGLIGDGPQEKLSVFTRNFVQYLKPGIYLQDAILDARSNTIQQAASQDGHRQHPAYYDQTTARICLSGNCETVAALPVVDQCKALFENAQSNRECYAFEAYLDSCTDHTYSPIARSFLRSQCRPIAPLGPDDSAVIQACDQSAGHPWHPAMTSGLVQSTGVEWQALIANKAVADCERAVKRFPNHTRSLAFLGRAFDKAGNYSLALKYYQLAADKDDSMALLGLGFLYQDGSGVPKNHERAFYFIQLAASQDYPPAHFNLGQVYELGRGVPQDHMESVKWYRKAAVQGYVSAQFNLGVMHEGGRGTRQSDTEAVKWYRKAADQGYAPAQFNLGVMYESGRGTRQSATEALKWYRMAADQGYASAQVNLGWMFKNGRGTHQDDTEAIKWFRKAADQGDTIALENLRLMGE